MPWKTIAFRDLVVVRTAGQLMVSGGCIVSGSRVVEKGFERVLRGEGGTTNARVF